MAFNLTESLAVQMARSKRIVVLSMHQPSPAMFSLLDKCFLVVQGNIAFAGRPCEAESFLLSAGVPCPEGQAVAEHLLAVAMDPVLRECLLEFVEQNGPVPKVGHPVLNFSRPLVHTARKDSYVAHDLLITVK